MTPLFFKLTRGPSLMVVPDTEAHLDGHTIITYTYSIFADKDDNDPRQAIAKEKSLHLARHNDPDYFGYISFEQSGRMFTYIADGAIELENGQVEEVIQNLTRIRENPALWQHIDSL